MNTLFLHVVLASSLLAGEDASPTFNASYSQARRQAASEQKPLAVFFGTGAKGWSKILGESEPSESLTDVLSRKYVCVYVNTSTAPGKALAQDFGIDGVGVVLSDRSGSQQAFWHQGTLSPQSLTRYLQKYGDSSAALTTTETTNSARTSLYPPNAAESITGSMGISGVSNAYAPASSYCPNCSGGGGGRRR